MSAALQFPYLAAAAEDQALWRQDRRIENPNSGPAFEMPAEQDKARQQEASAVPSLAFYRKHTEKVLLRYLYSSMLVGRAPNILRDPVARGWCSSRPVKSFEDSVIFVFDVEKCLARLTALDRLLLSRVVLQNYSLSETALLLRVSLRSIARRHGEALDRLTEILLEEGLLVVPSS